MLGAPLEVAAMSQFDTHPGSGGVATHPVTAKVVHDTRERRIPALSDGYVFQRVQEIWLQAQGWNKKRESIIEAMVLCDGTKILKKLTLL